MPNSYLENAQRWMDLSEIDYLGHFVKVWLAFNAWYRSAYTHNTDRKIINDIKWTPNTVRNKIIPLISNNSEEALQFRGYIGSLHHKLENYHINCGKEEDKQRISLTNIDLKENPNTHSTHTIHGINYTISRHHSSNSVNTVVTNRNGTALINLSQTKYNLGELEIHSEFVGNLTSFQQAYLRGFYKEISPRLYVDLTNNGTSQIQAGAYLFRCSPEELFAGVFEALYLMRCTLFHGELVPDRKATSCYEPAYHIVRTLLFSIT